MKIPYTYEVTESSEFGAVLLYKSPGYPDMLIGVHTPREGENPDDIAEMYAPHAAWIERDVVRVPMEVGATGTYVPPEPASVPADPRTPLRQAKDRKLAEIATWRYAQEVGGMNFRETRIPTDRASQASITRAYVSLSQGLIESMDLKLGNGHWMSLDLPEIQVLATLLEEHVQSCFTAERNLAAQVEAFNKEWDVDTMVLPEGFM